MPTFKEHLEKPQYTGKPNFFQASLTYKLASDEEQWIKVYLDVNNQDKINQLNYEYQGMKGFLPYFSALSVMARGLGLTEASEISFEDFYDFFEGDGLFSELMESGHIPLIQLPIILLRDTIQQYTGEENIIMSKADELVCRCFGVYHSDIKNLISSERSFELIDVIKKTHAGAGCGSCKGDVEEIYHEARFSFPAMITLNTVTPTGKLGDLTTAQWVVKIDKAMNDFKGQNGLQELDLELIKFKYPELRLKLHHPPEKLDPAKLKEKMEYFLSQSLQIKIEIKFF